MSTQPQNPPQPTPPPAPAQRPLSSYSRRDVRNTVSKVRNR